MTSYFLWDEGHWWWWSWSSRDWELAGRDPNDGGRYPVVLLTDISFDYALRRQSLTKPPQDTATDSVISIKDMQQWQSNWDRVAPYDKFVLVYEFYEKNSAVCKAMEKPFEKLARQYKGKAEFYKLDVDNFEFLARLCGVEGAYPTFVLFKNCKQVGKVVGLKEDELERSIQRALT